MRNDIGDFMLLDCELLSPVYRSSTGRELEMSELPLKIFLNETEEGKSQDITQL